jgi:hypothetical protein
MMIRAKIFGIGLPMLVLATAAHANVFTFQTAPGATESGGNAVNASGQVTTGAGTVTITLFNNLVNQTTVAQNISDFSFSLSGTTSLGSLASSSGQEINVAANGTFATGSTVATGWILSSPSSGSYILDALAAGGAGPEHTILGAPGAGGTYSNANGSIAGNDPHNPFLNQSATFTLNITGVTASTNVSNVLFSFGTVSGNNVPGGGVPEPLSLSLVGSGLLALGLLRKRLLRQ